MGLMGVMGAKFFEPPSSSFQGGRHISHQTSLLPVERECNRPWCSEPLRSKVGGASKISPCFAGWDRMATTC